MRSCIISAMIIGAAVVVDLFVCLVLGGTMNVVAEIEIREVILPKNNKEQQHDRQLLFRDVDYNPTTSLSAGSIPRVLVRRAVLEDHDHSITHKDDQLSTTTTARRRRRRAETNDKLAVPRDYVVNDNNIKTHKDDDTSVSRTSYSMNEKNSRIVGGGFHHNSPGGKNKHNQKITISNQRPYTSSNNGDSSSAQAQSRIVGGQPVSPKNRYPYMVVLYDINDQYISGATLIAPDIVLTAAHSTVVNIVSVGIGRFDLSDTNEDYEQIPVTQVIVNPNFRPRKFNHDAAILKLQYPSTYEPVTLNGDPNVPPDNTELTVMGWGVDESGALSDTLKETTVTSMTNEECETTTSYLDEDITNAMLCATGNGITDACDGDSGGPLILKGASASADIQVGIVSFGRGCANIDYPGVYTRISYILPWIQYEVCQLSPNYCNTELIPQCQDNLGDFTTSGGDAHTCEWVARRQYTRCPMYGLQECPVSCGKCMYYIEFPDGQEEIAGAYPASSTTRQRIRTSDSDLSSSTSTTAASTATTTATSTTTTTVVPKTTNTKEPETKSSSKTNSLWSMLVSFLTGHG